MSSVHDKSVLNCIFNPLSPISETIYDELHIKLQDEEDISAERKEAESLELEGVKATESGDVSYAIGLFTRAIGIAPNRASGHNNRAQAYRIQGNEQEPALREQQCSLYLAVLPSSPPPFYVCMGTTVKHHVVGTVKRTVPYKDFSALYDLDEAIRLSGGHGRSGCQALCQRALLYRKEGREDEARVDLQKAAAQGNQFARSQLVEMNPYAALCNAMLHNVMSKLSA
uniref:Tetratricopeptide repeat protein 36 n=1 Tax=Timema monikensis TaxID=170555 RepID=A0A7R9DWZ5_9NEOP|nr:unnamed protein product [Timema monikensis]